VKYELDASNLVLETCFNSSSVSVSDTDIKIPQYGTVKYVYQISDNTVTPSKLIEQNKETPIKDINSFNSDEQYFKATISSNGTNIVNEATCEDVGTYTYTVKLESANEWFICNSNTSKDFSVAVCPWKIILTMNDGSTVNTKNISLGTYTLSISNDAYTGTNKTLPDPKFSCLENNNIITDIELTIDEDFITGTITASIIINGEDVEVASLEISRIDTSTYEAFILCQRYTNGTEVTNVTGASISNSSTAATIVTVENLYNSDSVWTYFVNPEDKSRFTDDGNYKVSVDIKSASKSVVGISAARADYFFTVNDTWTTCEFETGYVKGSTEHDFTIGLGLSSETQIRNLKIEKLETTDATEPSLVFDISKDAITTYLSSANNSEKIVDVTKEATNGSYNITINTPMCHSTDNSVIQDVKLHLRTYSLDSLGANNVYFEIANKGNTNLETSVMADTASNKSISWNDNASPISANNFQTFSVDFPNYVENDELTVDLITSSTSISDFTSFTISNFAVGTVDATRAPFSNKIFVYKTNANDDKSDVFAKLEDSSTISINSDSQINFDVLMFNNDAWLDESNSLSYTAWNEATRFIFADTTSTIGNLTYNVSQDSDGNPIYTLQNNTDTPVTVKISLNEKYEVVIEEVPQVTLAEGLTCDVQDDTVSLYISSAEGLATFRDIVNGTLTEDISVIYDSNENSNHTFTANTSYPSVNGTLRDSITLSGEWTPIGVYSNETANAIPYSGLFDGNSNTIYFEDIIYTSSNLYSSGLFQMLAGTVQNVVTDGEISRTEAGDIGSITGYLDGGTIQYCTNKATISNVSMTGTGGIVGCVGTTGGKITGCINLGNISSELYAVGGIVGTTGNFLDSLNIEQCINLGQLVGENYISGILGNSGAANIVINNCINLGTINAKSTSFAYASGIAIPSASTGYSFSNSINVGQVSATGESSSKSGAISSIPTYGTYTNNYYDSTVNPSVVDSSTTGITGKSTIDLIGSNISLEGISDGQWSFAEGRYPLPNIAESVPDGENGEIWNAVIVAATPEDVPSGGGDGTVTGITYAGTDSTSNLPKFLISSPEGLSTFRDMVNGLVLSDITIPSDESLPNQQNYSVLKETPLTEIVGQLTSDIDLELYENWTPIGTNDNPFAGSFYGENYTVSNLNINATTDNQGLFGVVEGSSSRICNISKLNVEGTIISSNCNVGGIAGNATYTKFDSCVNKASVESTSSVTNVCVAGIVGYISNVEIEHCYNSGNIKANGAVAGIVGFESGSTISYPTFEYCINTGIITGGSYYGGIIGYTGKILSVGYCANYGTIISTSDNDTGCLIGGCSSSNKPLVTECLIVGKIETSGKYYAVSCNASVTNSIYDSTVLSDVTQNSSGGETGMATGELKSGTKLEKFEYGNWYYSENSYPIPVLEGYVSDEIWEEIKQEISSL